MTYNNKIEIGDLFRHKLKSYIYFTNFTQYASAVFFGSYTGTSIGTEKYFIILQKKTKQKPELFNSNIHYKIAPEMITAYKVLSGKNIYYILEETIINDMEKISNQYLS